MDVTDVLRDRMEEPGGLSRMVGVSIMLHAGLALVVALGSARLFGRPASERTNVMTISISGAGEGPRNGGFTAAASQPVQTQAPPAEPQKREPVRPPAAATPEMVLPTNKPPVRASKTPAPIVKDAPRDARGRNPTRGDQTTAGNALTYTGARGQGFGLSTGGGAGTGSTLDVADFCCPDYIVLMIDRIRSAWQQNQGGRGDVLVKFTIQRTGQITDASVERSSGASMLDLAALRAVMSTRTLNPLPAQFPNPTLTVHLNFQYQ
jgi:periplasmic protein TonB